jgi:cytochrome b
LLLVCQRAASARLDIGRIKQSGQAAPNRKEVVGNAVPQQHPAEVLRFHHKQLRALLAIAMVAVVGLTTTVVILANDSDEVADTGTAQPAETAGAARNQAAAEASPGKLAVKTHENAARLLRARIAVPAAATGVASPGAATSGLDSYKDYSKNSASGDALPPSTR